MKRVFWLLAWITGGFIASTVVVLLMTLLRLPIGDRRYFASTGNHVEIDAVSRRWIGAETILRGERGMIGDGSISTQGNNASLRLFDWSTIRTDSQSGIMMEFGAGLPWICCRCQWNQRMGLQNGIRLRGTSRSDVPLSNSILFMQSLDDSNTVPFGVLLRAMCVNALFWAAVLWSMNTIVRSTCRYVQHNIRYKMMRCCSCGYDIKYHNIGERCPECGTIIIKRKV